MTAEDKSFNNQVFELWEMKFLFGFFILLNSIQIYIALIELFDKCGCGFKQLLIILVPIPIVGACYMFPQLTYWLLSLFLSLIISSIPTILGFSIIYKWFDGPEKYGR